MSRTTGVVLILTGIVIIVISAVGGLVMPIVSSTMSGETLLRQSVGTKESITVNLDPSMNPIRAILHVRYQAPSRLVGGRTSIVKAQLRTSEKQVWEISTGFSDSDQSNDGENTTAGAEIRTVGLQEFSVDDSTSYQLDVSLELNESFKLLSNEIEFRERVEPIQWSTIAIGGSGILFGILLILGVALSMASRMKFPSIDDFQIDETQKTNR